MQITWDEKKAQANLKKHGVSFDEAATVLSDPLAQTYQEDGTGEDRQIWVGHSALSRLLLVVVFEKSETEIRIISARQPTAKERETYEEGI